MASITYTCNLNSQAYWGNQGSVDLSGPSATMPDGSIVTEISLEVYCGVSTYDKDCECSYRIYDTSGNYVDIEDWCNSGDSNRVTVTPSGTPDTQLDWNNLSTIDVDGNTTLTLRDSSAVLTLTYITPSLGTPGTPTITQNNDGTFSVSWAAASYSGGTGSISYDFWSHTDGYSVYNTGTSTSCKLKISTYAGYNFAFQYKIRATYTGLETFSGYVNKTFYKPSISKPTLYVNAAEGTTCTLNWDAAILSYTTGTITYYIYKGSTQVATTTSLSYTFDQNTVKTWGDSAVSFYVVAKGTSLSNTDNGTTLTSSNSNTVSFTYKAPYKTIAYYTSSGWVNCLVYYYTSEGWKLCDPYYYTSSGWQSCSTT